MVPLSPYVGLDWHLGIIYKYFVFSNLAQPHDSNKLRRFGLPFDLLLKSTATISVLVVFIMQPIIWLWLYVSTRMIAHFEQANT